MNIPHHHRKHITIITTTSIIIIIQPKNNLILCSSSFILSPYPSWHAQERHRHFVHLPSRLSWRPKKPPPRWTTSPGHSKPPQGIGIFWNYTPINMESNNEGFGRWFSFANGWFLIFHVNLPGCTPTQDASHHQNYDMFSIPINIYIYILYINLHLPLLLCGG